MTLRVGDVVRRINQNMVGRDRVRVGDIGVVVSVFADSVVVRYYLNPTYAVGNYPHNVEKVGPCPE